MRQRRIFRILIPAAVLLLFSFGHVQAQPGDCNFDGFVNTSDMTYLISYLFTGGPAPDLIDCDCDGFPGVNYGDLWQLTAGLFMGATLYASPGTDYPIPCGVKFLALGRPDGQPVGLGPGCHHADAAIAGPASRMRQPQ